MSRFFYSAFFYLAVPFVLIRLLWRSRKEPEYRFDVKQRFGFFKSRNAGEVIWIHAVSAGETIAVAPLVKRLVDRGYACLVTNMTPTGRDRVRNLLGQEVENAYAPYDLPDAVARFLEANQPILHVIVDTELWPNSLAECRRRSIPVLLVNGRMSERSARGYLKIGALSRPMFTGLSALSVQTRQHGERFVELGAAEDRVHVSGSIKFDGSDGPEITSKIKKVNELIEDDRMLLGASTHDGEESALIEVYLAAREIHSNLRLVLVPRHTHRVSEVSNYCEAAGLSVTLWSKSEGQSLASDVLIVDVMGELAALFHVSDVALVGGSLVPVGGHNLMEAVRGHCAVVMGRHLDNIDDIARQFEDAGGMVVARDHESFVREVLDLLSNDERRQSVIESANQVLEANLGALDRIESLILNQLERERS